MSKAPYIEICTSVLTSPNILLCSLPSCASDSLKLLFIEVYLFIYLIETCFHKTVEWNILFTVKSLHGGNNEGNSAGLVLGLFFNGRQFEC